MRDVLFKGLNWWFCAQSVWRVCEDAWPSLMLVSRLNTRRADSARPRLI